MRSTLIWLVALAAGLCPSSAHAQQRFPLFVRVVDASGTPVDTLDPANVTVQEDGKDATVVKVEPIAWPVKVQILVDNGIGLGAENISILRTGVRGLIEALPRGIEVSMYTTAPQPRPLVKAATTLQPLLDAIGRLAPDTGTGTFVDSLSEAAQRYEKDREKDTGSFPVIVSVGTMAGDTETRPFQVERMTKRLAATRPTVYVVLLDQGTSPSSTQINVGKAVARNSGGRFETIAAPSRLATLLPEIGQQIAKSDAVQRHQFRLIIDRPAGATGKVGPLTMSVSGGLTAMITLDGHIPQK